MPPGRAIVIGLGIGFSTPMLGISWVQEKYTRFSLQDKEQDLIASGIVSACTWAATLLQSFTEDNPTASQVFMRRQAGLRCKADVC